MLFVLVVFACDLFEEQNNLGRVLFGFDELLESLEHDADRLGRDRVRVEEIVQIG